MTQDGAILRVDLEAIARNYRLLRTRFTGAECGAVVKADAYGLGAVAVAKKLLAEGCRSFFVATLDEALTLKAGLASLPRFPRHPEAKPKDPVETARDPSVATLPQDDARIFVFHGPAKGEETEFLAHGISPVLNSMNQLERWKSIYLSFPRKRESSPAVFLDSRFRGNDSSGISAALHIDTGMCRLGLEMREAEMLDEETLAACGIRLVMSHLACAGEPKHPMNAQQRARGATLKSKFPNLPFSLANSSGIFLSPDFHFDLARPGCALYGITPNESLPNPMENVVELSAPILQLRVLEEEAPIGYGATVTAAKGTKVATVAFGYADGMLRALSGRAVSHVKGLEVPILGRVSMDMIMLDVTQMPDLKPGDRAVLIGPDQPVDKVAARAGTIGYEIFTRLGNRVAREYIGQP